MKASQIPLFTLKEDPRDAQVVSHKWLVRAGYIKKQAAGMYILLPFAWMVHQKIETIIREEMLAAGAVEVKLPVLTPAELWQQSGRWSSMGAEMMRMQDRHQNSFALGPTHEESMVSLVSSFVQSYKQLPLNMFQIGTKYRDEIRPRYGLIRCREFVMKDGYSFHTDEASLDEGYQNMRRAYRRVFERSGLKTIPVDADSGAIGGSASEEFMVASEIGEETLLLAQNEHIDYKANQEKTEFIPAADYPQEKSSEQAQDVETPKQKSIEDVAAFLQAKPESFIKTVIMENQDHLVFAFVPGNRDLNEAKLKAVSALPDLEMADDEHILQAVQAPVGFIGPQNLPVAHAQTIELTQNNTQNNNEEENKLKKKVLIYFDRHLKGRGNLIAGANRKDFHTKYLQEGRDFTADPSVDLVLAQAGDLCPLDKKTPLISTKGIEVGHIFKLGDKYTTTMNFTVLDENGKPLVPLMGTYGIGLGRILATVVEQSHDEKGIVWSKTLSPFWVYFISLAKTPAEQEIAEHIYNELQKNNISVYFDNRKERPGIKFNDADMVGFPWQIIAGKNFFADDTSAPKLELKKRKNGEKKLLTLQEIIGELHNESALDT